MFGMNHFIIYTLLAGPWGAGFRLIRLKMTEMLGLKVELRNRWQFRSFTLEKGSYPFILVTLLRYNSHIIQFTHLKCTVQGFLVCSRSCTIITTNSFRTFSSPQKGTPYPLAATPNLLPTHPSPRQPLIYFLSLWIHLHFIEMESYNIRSFLSLSIMFSSFSHVVACVSISFRFIAE